MYFNNNLFNSVFFVLIIYKDLFLNIYFYIYYGMMQVFIPVSVF